MLEYPSDKVWQGSNEYNPRLPTSEIRELQDAHNVNMCDECDSWFDEDEVTHLEVIDEVEFFNRYVF